MVGIMCKGVDRKIKKFPGVEGNEKKTENYSRGGIFVLCMKSRERHGPPAPAGDAHDHMNGFSKSFINAHYTM